MNRKAKGDDTNDLEIEALENGEIKTEGEIFLNIKKIDTRIYRIEKSDLEGLPEFEGRDIDELKPTLVLVKTYLNRTKYFRVFSMLKDSHAFLELTQPISNTKLFEVIETEEGFLKFAAAISKFGGFHWSQLLNEVDNETNIKKEGLIL